MKAKSIAGVLAILCAFGSVHAPAAAEISAGDAYDLKSGALLFREMHYRYTAKDMPQQLVLYQCPDGRPFARKLSHEDGDAQAPDFDLIDARLNYHEGVRRRADRREVYVQRSESLPELVDPLAVPVDGVIDHGSRLPHARWADLDKGTDSLACVFGLDRPLITGNGTAAYRCKALSDF